MNIYAFFQVVATVEFHLDKVLVSRGKHVGLKARPTLFSERPSVLEFRLVVFSKARTLSCLIAFDFHYDS